MVLHEQEPGTSAPAVVGQALPYIDAVERVTGLVPYTLNLELPGMLHVKVLRSPHAHARIRSIDASAAERLPGVAGVLTGPRLLELGIGTHYGVVVQDKPIVALDRVRYVGDVVAAVAAVARGDAPQLVEAAELAPVEGASVRLRSMNMTGRITRRLGDDLWEVQVGHLKVKASAEDFSDVLPPDGGARETAALPSRVRNARSSRRRHYCRRRRSPMFNSPARPGNRLCTSRSFRQLWRP